MEGNQNGWRPKWKAAKMEDDQKWKMTKQKTTKTEDRIKLGYFQKIRVLHIFALRDFFGNILIFL